jgi:hypothetical protein
MQKNHAAKAAGSGAPASELANEKGHVASAAPFEIHQCGQPNFASPAPEGKELATIRAALALKGYALHRMSDGCLLIERWGYSRTVDNINQAAQFLAQIGGR